MPVSDWSRCQKSPQINLKIDKQLFGVSSTVCIFLSFFGIMLHKKISIFCPYIFIWRISISFLIIPVHFKYTHGCYQYVCVCVRIKYIWDSREEMTKHNPDFKAVCGTRICWQLDAKCLSLIGEGCLMIKVLLDIMSQRRSPLCHFHFQRVLTGREAQLSSEVIFNRRKKCIKRAHMEMLHEASGGSFSGNMKQLVIMGLI